MSNIRVLPGGKLGIGGHVFERGATDDGCVVCQVGTGKAFRQVAEKGMPALTCAGTPVIKGAPKPLTAEQKAAAAKAKAAGGNDRRAQKRRMRAIRGDWDGALADLSAQFAASHGVIAGEPVVSPVNNGLNEAASVGGDVDWAKQDRLHRNIGGPNEQGGVPVRGVVVPGSSATNRGNKS